jgi:hypothetical protein
MLYDPKWEKPNVLESTTLADLIAWLETKPPAKTYDYLAVSRCLLCQYLQDRGIPEPTVTNKSWGSHPTWPERSLPPHFDDIAAGRIMGVAPASRLSPWSYGSALARARSIAAEA